MLTFTRAPKLLVKLRGSPQLPSFNFNSTQLNVGFEKLFQSIGQTGAVLPAAGSPQWYLMSADDGGEVNVWDLCHHLVGHGFGVAGAPAADFAEPDLE